MCGARAALLAVALLVALTSCVATKAPIAHVRFVHAVPDAPPVDIYLDDHSDTPIIRAIEFAKVTAFHALPAVNHTVWIAEAGAGRAKATAYGPLGPFNKDKHYTIAGVGVLKLNKVQVVLKQDHVAISWKGSKIKFVNFAPELSFMDVVNVETDPKGNIHQSYLFKHVPYGKASKQALLLGDAAYRLQFLLTRSKSVYVDAKEVYLDSSGVFTCFVMGFVARGDLGGKPRIRAVVVRDAWYKGPEGDAAGPWAHEVAVAEGGGGPAPRDYLPALEIAEALAAARPPWAALLAALAPWAAWLRRLAGLSPA